MRQDKTRQAALDRPLIGGNSVKAWSLFFVFSPPSTKLFSSFFALSNAPESPSAGFLGREEKKRLVLGCKRMVETVACVALLVCGLPFALDG